MLDTPQPTYWLLPTHNAVYQVHTTWILLIILKKWALPAPTHARTQDPDPTVDLNSNFFQQLFGPGLEHVHWCCDPFNP